MRDTYAPMIESSMAYIYFDRIADRGLSDCKALVDMMVSVWSLVDDLCKKAIDGKYVMPDDAIAETHEVYNALYHYQLTYAQFKEILQNLIDRYLMDNEATCNSMSISSEMDPSPIDEYLFTSNVIDSNLRKLSAINIGMMLDRLVCSAKMAKSAVEIEHHKSHKKEYSDLLENKK